MRLTSVLPLVLCALALACGEGESVQDRPEIVVQPGSLDFGRLAVGTADTRYLAVGNDGSGPLTLRAPRLGGASPEAFSLPSELSGATVQPGARFTVAVTFAPTTAGQVEATLELPHDAINQPTPLGVPLVGEGY